eukprot:Em0012g20a
MVDLETAARSFKDALDAPGAVESATQLRTLLASIKADLQRLLRRIHPPGSTPVVCFRLLIAGSGVAAFSTAVFAFSFALRRRRRHGRRAPVLTRRLPRPPPPPGPPPPRPPPQPARSHAPSFAGRGNAAPFLRYREAQIPDGSYNSRACRYPIESAVAGASCTATIASCEPDVLARYVSCLVECEQLDPNLAARLESLVEDAARLTSGMSLFDQVRTLFGVTNALQNLTNWRVGRILMDAPGRDDVELANFCGEYLTRLLRDLVARCSDQFGCVTCSSHLADPISTTFPCRTVQRTFRLLQHNAVNVNTASLKECSAYPTSVKRIVSRLGDLKAYYSRTLAVPMPSYAMATLPVFALAAGCSAWEAVNYCDGDGGSILVEQFPGLSKYLRQQNVATHILAAPQCTLVQFREAFHDAVELGHQYTVVATREDDEPGPSTRQPTTSVLRRNYGYQALVHARHALATAKVILLVCHGVHRGDGGDRIVVEVVIRDVTSGTFLVSGLSRVQCGFSFPVQNAPRHYVIAKEEAVAAHCGVLEIGPSMAGQEAMPWSLKEAFSSGQSPVAIAGCLITNSTQFLNQSHLHIHTSFIPGAGWGLMIRPCPNATIPRGAYVCHFAIGQPPSTAPPSDYELSSTRRGSLLVYDPQVYDGHNIGRFINQGGLLEGLKELVAASDRDRGCTAYSPTVAEAIFADRSCVEYHVANGGSEMVVRASKPISSHPCRMIELLANYGLPYWLAHVVKYHRHIGHDSDLVKCVFWLLLSDKSTMPIQPSNAQWRFTTSFPPGCSGTACSYFLAVRTNEDPLFLDFMMEGNARGWIAVGYTPNPDMTDADVFVCALIGGQVTILDTYNIPNGHSIWWTQARFSRAAQTDDLLQDLDLLDGRYFQLIGWTDAATLPVVLALIRAHGILMIVAWPTVYVTANLFGIFMQPARPGTPMYWARRGAQVITLIAGIAAALCIFVARKVAPALGDFNNPEVSAHFVLGIILIVLNIINGLDDPDCLVPCSILAVYLSLINIAIGLSLFEDILNMTTIAPSLAIFLAYIGTFAVFFICGLVFYTLLAIIKGSSKLAPSMVWPLFKSSRSAQWSPDPSKVEVLMTSTAQAASVEIKASDPAASDPAATKVEDDTPSNPSNAQWRFTTSFPPGCNGTACSYFLAVRTNEDPLFLDFMMEGNARGWIAVGYTPNPGMPDADVFACAVIGGNVSILDTYDIPDYRSNVVDTIQDLCPFSGSFINGRIRCVFSRAIKTNDVLQDKALNQSYYQLNGWTDATGSSVNSLVNHGVSIPMVSDSKVNPTTSVSAVTAEVKIDPLIRAHGILMIVAWPVLGVMGIFFAAWMKPALPKAEWFQAHRAMLLVSLFLGCVAFLFAFVAKRAHHISISLYSHRSKASDVIFIVLHLPSFSYRRWIFNLVHGTCVGLGVELLALINVGIGLAIFGNKLSLATVAPPLAVYLAYVAFLVILIGALFIIYTVIAMKTGSPPLAPSMLKPLLMHITPSSPVPIKTEIAIDMATDGKTADSIKSSPGDQNPPQNPPDGQKPPAKPPSKDAPLRWAGLAAFLVVMVPLMLAVIILIAAL